MKNLFILGVAVSFVSLAAFGQSDVRLGGSIGPSKIVSDNGDVWRLGFYLSGDVFYRVSDSFEVGGVVNLHRFAPDEDALMDKAGLNSSIYDIDVSGSSTFFQILSAVRTSIQLSPKTDLFVSGGFGVTFMRMQSEVRASIGWISASDEIDESEARPSLFIANGIYFGSAGKFRFGINIAFHHIFIENGSTQLLTAGFGISK